MKSFVRVAQLNKKDKEMMRKYWDDKFPKSYVDAYVDTEKMPSSDYSDFQDKIKDRLE